MSIDSYFAFLRYALLPDSPPPPDIAAIDWEGLYSFGLRQALVGVLFSGIERLPAGSAPPQGQLMQWVVRRAAIQRANTRVNMVAGEIFNRFTSAGFRCCLLKGQGNALMYTDPYARSAGDVDLWVCGYAEAASAAGSTYPSFAAMERRVVDYCTQHFAVHKVRSHHACFEYNNVEVEAHFAPSERANPKYNARYERWFRAHAAAQCDNYVSLPDDCGRVAVPTLAFNLVYQVVHLFHHFFDMGLGMRQVVDYWHLLMMHAVPPAVTRQVVDDLRYLGLLPFAAALMWVLQQTLHVPAERLLVAPDARRGIPLLDEIINGGNFGKYDSKYGDITHKNLAGRYFTKTYRNLSFLSYYPSEALCEPFCRTYHFFRRKAKGW